MMYHTGRSSTIRHVDLQLLQVWSLKGLLWYRESQKIDDFDTCVTNEKGYRSNKIPERKNYIKMMLKTRLLVFFILGPHLHTIVLHIMNACFSSCKRLASFIKIPAVDRRRKGYKQNDGLLLEKMVKENWIKK